MSTDLANVRDQWRDRADEAAKNWVVMMKEVYQMAKRNWQRLSREKRFENWKRESRLQRADEKQARATERKVLEKRTERNLLAAKALRERTS